MSVLYPALKSSRRTQMTSASLWVALSSTAHCLRSGASLSCLRDFSASLLSVPLTRGSSSSLFLCGFSTSGSTAGPSDDSSTLSSADLTDSQYSSSSLKMSVSLTTASLSYSRRSNCSSTQRSVSGVGRAGSEG